MKFAHHCKHDPGTLADGVTSLVITGAGGQSGTTHVELIAEDVTGYLHLILISCCLSARLISCVSNLVP